MRAAVMVPKIPARTPNRIATSTMIPKNKKRSGKKLLNELAWNMGVKQAAAAAAQDATPSHEDVQCIMRK
jgi:hypothetical protein